MIKLKSRDDVVFEVPENVVMLSKQLSRMVEAQYSPETEIIPVPVADARILEKVIEYCSQQVDPDFLTKPIDERSNWDKQFVNVEAETLYDLAIAAEWMDIDQLLELISKEVACMIKGKTPEEIRQIFSIQNDLTKEEEEVVAEEIPWVLD